MHLWIDEIRMKRKRGKGGKNRQIECVVVAHKANLTW